MGRVRAPPLGIDLPNRRGPAASFRVDQPLRPACRKSCRWTGGQHRALAHRVLHTDALQPYQQTARVRTSSDPKPSLFLYHVSLLPLLVISCPFLLPTLLKSSRCYEFTTRTLACSCSLPSVFAAPAQPAQHATNNNNKTHTIPSALPRPLRIAELYPPCRPCSTFLQFAFRASGWAPRAPGSSCLRSKSTMSRLRRRSGLGRSSTCCAQTTPTTALCIRTEDVGTTPLTYVSLLFPALCQLVRPHPTIPFVVAGLTCPSRFLDQFLSIVIVVFLHVCALGLSTVQGAVYRWLGDQPASSIAQKLAVWVLLFLLESLIL